MNSTRRCDRCGATLNGARCENCAPPAPMVTPMGTTTDELEIDRLRDQVAQLEKLRDELCTAENGGPSRALAIITLGQALKDKAALKVEYDKVLESSRRAAKALASWVEVFDRMALDPEDPATAIRERFHGARIRESRAAIAELKQVLP